MPDHSGDCPYKEEGIGKKQFGALVTILIFMTVQLCTLIWWASYINTSMKFYADQLLEVKTIVQQNLAGNYKETDAARDLNVRDLKIKDIENHLLVLDGKATANEKGIEHLKSKMP